MENHVKKLYHRLPMFLVGLVVWSSLFVSCKDDYPYDDTQPDWLGESIYEYLVADGNYTNFVKIIDDLEYSEVLRKTGSKTLFVANDAAFVRFFENNEWGVTSYAGLSEAQKKLLLNFSVINNSYLIETMSNYYDGTALQEGSAIRRATTVSLFDTIPFVLDNKLPVTTKWKPFLNSVDGGMYLLQDASSWPMVHLLQKALDYNGITNADFKTMTGIDRQRNDAHIFSNKVITRDIACKNGYINVLENVMIPPTNMAAYIHTVPQFSTFSKILDWFSAPYFDRANTTAYRTYMSNKGLSFENDSLYELNYYATTASGGRVAYPDGTSIGASKLLLFDPGYNSYASAAGRLQSDMAAIFVPTDEAMTEYLTAGKGRALFDRYGLWENIIPKATDSETAMTQKMELLALLVNRHMRESLVNSVPSLFYKMVDKTSSSLRTKSEDIIDSLNYVGLNGLVYATNKVYPPDDFVSVYGPVFFSNKTTVLRNSIVLYKYNLYLNSMVNKYAFVAPTDKALKYYIDPVSYGSIGKPSVLKFWYDDAPSVMKVKATVYNYNITTNTIGDSVAVIDNAAFIKSRLVNILDQSIVVKDFVNNTGSFKDGYYVTKDGNILKVSNLEGMGTDVITSPTTSFQGGGDILATPERFVHPRDSGIYHQENGTTFLVDDLVQTPLRSVYSILSDATNYPEFQEFFNLLTEFPNSNVFINKTNYFGIDGFNVKFFNTFRYTVYAPDNAAMNDAYTSGVIKSWTDINNMPTVTTADVTAKNAEITKLERFVRYHFQDNSVFIGANQSLPSGGIKYQTATIKKTDEVSFFDTAKNKFYRIAVSDTTISGNKSLKLTCDKPGASPYTATVNVSDAKYYNIMTRDYVFNLDPKSLTTLTSGSYLTSEITTSSTAVIHRIGQVLRFE